MLSQFKDNCLLNHCFLNAIPLDDCLWSFISLGWFSHSRPDHWSIMFISNGCSSYLTEFGCSANLSFGSCDKWINAVSWKSFFKTKYWLISIKGGQHKTIVSIHLSIQSLSRFILSRPFLQIPGLGFLSIWEFRVTVCFLKAFLKKQRGVTENFGMLVT